jgi:hypothetical protein
MFVRRRFAVPVTMTGVAVMLAVFLAACGSDKEAAPKAVQGITDEAYRETFERLPLNLLTMDEIMAKWPRDTASEPASAAGTAPQEAAEPMPAIYIENGKYNAEKSKSDLVSGGNVEDSAASEIKISASGDTCGGVFVSGEGPEYTLSNAEIELTGDVEGLGGASAGAGVDDHGTLVLKNVSITATGSGRNTISATNNSTLKVYNSTLIGHDAPFDAGDHSTHVSQALEINGNSRTTITMQNSYTYLYDSTIVADGWGALSTDAGGDFVYLEANNCKVKTVSSGYCAYADLQCHDTFNNCEFDSAAMAVIIAGVGDATFNDTRANCETYFALMHCVTGSPTEVGTLNVTGGQIVCKSPAVIIKSHNADLNFDGVTLATESGVLIKTMVNPDPNATPTEGKTVYGIHASFKDMEVAGDIIHEDTDRILSVDLKSTTLRGAMKNACLMLDAASKWVATGDSSITLVGSVSRGQIDAPEGVTVTALASETGTMNLPGGGTLILKAI